MELVYVKPGVGKSRTALWWVANNSVVHIQVMQTITPRWLLVEIVKELGAYLVVISSD